ncbi:MAG: tRNA (guanosine(37)-N1)-methyltransferase TrmD [Deltaproteobacteria bacterium]|nr:MAG: tRNA (guanosine(37)-N1)-methyltransferase TrmD [Deltaproteobacteria bacterium]
MASKQDQSSSPPGGRQPGLRFDVIALFPEIVAAVATTGVIGKAVESGLLEVHLHQLRDYTGGSPHPIDDSPYGGGPGMVMRCEPIYAAVEDVRRKARSRRAVLLTPQGRPFDQRTARRLAEAGSLLLFCGRYEGIDERARPLFDEEISLGDFVLTGGEIAAAALIDAVGRLVPGVLGSPLSPCEESFSEGLLEHPQYTRPEVFRGMRVPGVLLSGNHAEIARWRRRQAVARTRERRPDLAAGGDEDDG